MCYIHFDAECSCCDLSGTHAISNIGNEEFKWRNVDIGWFSIVEIKFIFEIVLCADCIFFVIEMLSFGVKFNNFIRCHANLCKRGMDVGFE